jgi:glucose-6-phosphate 1-dehydrogenase
VIAPGHEKTAACTESIASRHPAAGEMDAYERLLGDAMEGDQTLFAREDYVEEAWRIVDPVLNVDTPVLEYDANTWGPAGADQHVCPPDGWQNPMALLTNSTRTEAARGG